MSDADFRSGFLSRTDRDGGSVARARAANVSMMRFTQSNCTAFCNTGQRLMLPGPHRRDEYRFRGRLLQILLTSTDSSSAEATAETNVRTTAVTLTVSWNCRNFLTESLTARPHIIPLTIEAKLSSMRMIADASLATSVPAIPTTAFRVSYQRTKEVASCQCGEE